MSAKPVDVLAVMDARIAEMSARWQELRPAGDNGPEPPSLAQFREARAAVAELVDCVGDAQSLLAEIDKAVRAEHTKNGAPKSQSVAGIINARLTAALARVQGGAA